MRWLPVLLLSGASISWAAGQDPAPAAPAAGAPEEATAPEAVSAKALEDLVATIEDPERRAKLVSDLKSLLAVTKQAEGVAQPEGPGLIGHLGSFFGRLSADVRRTAVELVDQLGRLPSMTRNFVRRFDDPTFSRAFIIDIVKSAGVLLASLLAALVAWLIARGLRSTIIGPPPGSEIPRVPLLGKLWRLTAVTCLHLLPSAAALFAGTGGLTLLPLSPEARAVTLAMILAVASQGAVIAALEAVFATRMPALRIPPLSDERAAQLSSSLSRIAAFGIFGAYALQAMRDLGADPVLMTPLRSAYGLVLLGLGVAFVLRERIRVRSALESRASQAASATDTPPPPSADAPAAAALATRNLIGGWKSALLSVLGLWWVAAIVYMVALYMVWVSGVEGGARFIVTATFKTLAVLGVAAVTLYVIRRAAAGLRAALGGAFARLPEIHARVPSYVNAFAFILRAVISVLAACIVLEIWGLVGLDVLASPAVKDIVSAVTGILVTLLLAAATIDVATVFTRRYLESRERAGRVTSQIRTLVPLTQKAIRATVCIVAAVMILGQLGLQIGPILAGIGVVGLAVGFGAQTLVKDLITGMFMLLEGTVGVGDIVRINETSGSVETINLRTLRIRDVAGSVHTIPYSSVTTVVNMSKDFGRAVIDASVGYNEDIDEVSAILKEIGDELRTDPRFAPDILEPIEVSGLERFDESAVVVRARILTSPNQQFRVGREFQQRMKKVFDERGIEMPFPHRKVILETQGGSGNHSQSKKVIEELG